MKFFARLLNRQGPDHHRWLTLATYNSEKSRGLVHTPEYDERMAQEQAQFDADFDAWLLTKTESHR